MIIRLLSNRLRFFWIVMHILLGIAATFGNFFVIAWFYFTLANSFYIIYFSNVKRPMIIAATMIYIGAFELLARMTKCSPIIPWEASKYMFTILSLMGIYFTMGKKRANKTGLLVLLLLIPSIFIDKSGLADSGDVIFNIMGLVNIGLGLIFFSSLKINKSRFIEFIRLIIYPCITILIFTIIKTPDLDEIAFSLGAQVSTSGDFGSNQVSTILGLGFMLATISWLLNWNFTSNRIGDGILAILFLIQGLFTFSRGGMIGAGIAILTFMIIILSKSQSQYKFHIPKSVKRYSIPAIILFVIAINFTNDLTGGKLFLRYQGETQGTVTGTRERDLTTITSNRNVIFLSDIELWAENPILGSGAGTSKYLRSEGKGLAAHIELSRLLAEHGILGLIIFMILIIGGINYLKERDLLIKAIKLSFFVLAIFTTFHSATRTFLTPLLLSVCSINVSSLNKNHAALSGK